MPNSRHFRRPPNPPKGETDTGNGRDPSREWPLVGRDEELALIDRALSDEAVPGVLLAGAAGTGKTRLANETRALAASKGLPTFFLAATRATTAVPLAVFAPLDTAVPGATRNERILLDALLSLGRGPEKPVVAIDNVDLLDRPSMAVVHAAAGSGAIKLVGTLRTDENATTDVVALWRDIHLRRLEVQALSRDQTNRLLRAGLGGEIDRMAARLIWDASAGVPLYVRELALEAIAQHTLTRTAGVWMASGSLPTPASLRDLVHLRMTDLDVDTSDAAEIMAVAERINHSDLTAMVGPDAVHSLETSGILQIHHEVGMPTATFAHPLFGEVIRHSMTRTRHAEISGRLADRYVDDASASGVSLVRIASWQLDARATPNPAVWTDAAHEAYRSGDFALAERLADAVAPANPAATVLLAQLHHERGDHAAAESISAAANLGTFDETHRRQALVQRAVNLFFGLGKGGEALELLTPIDPSNAAWFLLNMGRVSESSASLAGMESDPGAVVTRIWIDAVGGSPDVGVERARGAIADTGPRGLLPSRFRDFPEIPLALAMLEAGHLDEADRVTRTGLEDSVERHPDFIRAWWLFLSARVMLDRGRLSTAVRLFTEGAAIQRDMNQPGLLRWYLGGAASAYAQSTNPSVALELLSECDRIGARDERLFDFGVEVARSWLMARAGDKTGAVDLLSRVGDRLAADGADSLARRVWFEVARLGSGQAVSHRLDGATELDALRHDFARANSGPDHAAVAEGFESLGAHLWAAEAWNAASLAHRRSGDQRSATATLRRTNRCLSVCEDADTPGLVNENTLTPLTDREREVIGLAARGTASKQIAETLFISVRTVNNLIQRAYTKLGVSSRAEAATALGLTNE